MADDRISEVLVPTEDLIEIKKVKKSIVERPLYPAYAFAKIDLDTGLWHRIQSMPKLEDLLVNQKTNCFIWKRYWFILEKVKNRAAAKPKVSFDEGEMVRINEGPFANFNGIVEDFDMVSGLLKLNVSILEEILLLKSHILK